MNCKNCRNKIEDNSAFCENCGAPNKPSNIENPGKKKAYKGVLIAAIAIICVVAGSAGACIYLFNDNAKPVSNEIINTDKTVETSTDKADISDEYKEKSKTESVQRSTKVSDYVDGAFRHITVPPEKAIEIPNTSDGSLPVSWKGTANVMEIAEDGKVNSREYNETSTSGNISISRHAKVVIQNSGSSDVTVSVSADYTEYLESKNMVYDAVELNSGQSVSFTAKQPDTIYVDDTVYDYIEFKSDNNELVESGVKGSKSVSVSNNRNYLITASEPIVIHYCPLTIDRTIQNESAFDEIIVKSGKTVRIHSTDKSKNTVYGNNIRCDYVVYGMNDTVKKQQQDVTFSSVTIDKNCYIDFTNKAANQVKIKVPNLGFKVEEK